MYIGLVRHGETSWNAEARIQGQTDIELNENGIEQARRLANFLAKEPKIWDYVMTSDLKRAIMTGERISQKLHIPLLGPDQRLRERFFGEIEGTTLEERVERWGEEWKSLDLGAESDDEMRSRGVQCMIELTKNYPNDNILCVAHGSFIAHLLLELFPQLEDQRIGNLSYSILKYSAEGWQLELHNFTDHLND